VSEEEEFFATKFSKRNRAPVGIQEFHLEHAGRMYFDDGADLPGNQSFSGFVVQEGYNIEQFYQPDFHGDFIARNR